MNKRATLIVVQEPDEFRHKQRNFFASVAAQTCPQDAFELIMVGGDAAPSSTDAFAAFRLQHPALSATLLRSPSPARAVGNNLAVTRACGELLIFLADDFDPSPDLVAAHVAFHTLNPDGNAAGIGPGLFPDDGRQDVFARWLEDSDQIFGVSMRQAMGTWPRSYFYVGNASMKKAKFDALGGFDERFPHDAWDDYEFGLRWAASGGYSQFIATAVATHRHAVSFEERCAVMERAGASARIVERLHPHLDHGWRAMLRRGAAARSEMPDQDAPTPAWIAFYAEQLAVAFRRGYLSGIDSPPAPGAA
jgi:hypothetical protein